MPESSHLRERRPTPASPARAPHLRPVAHDVSAADPPEEVLLLQRSLGNQEMQRLLASHLIQAKPGTDQPADQHEGQSQALPLVEEVLCSPGEPLDPATRASMESRLDHDFSSVRLHTDAKAAQSARSLNAAAYTVGRDVVLAEPAGDRLLAHELAHVAQQAGATAPSGPETLSTPTRGQRVAPSRSPGACVPASRAAPLRLARQAQTETNEDVLERLKREQRRRQELRQAKGTTSPTSSTEPGSMPGTAAPQRSRHPAPPAAARRAALDLRPLPCVLCQPEVVARVARAASALYRKTWRREQVLSKAIGSVANRELRRLGVPPMSFSSGTTGASAGAFDWRTWSVGLWVTRSGLAPGRSPDAFAELFISAIHEAEHAAEWFQAVRYRLAQGAALRQVIEEMEIPERVARSAHPRRLGAGSEEFDRAEGYYFRLMRMRASWQEAQEAYGLAIADVASLMQSIAELSRYHSLAPDIQSILKQLHGARVETDRPGLMRDLSRRLDEARRRQSAAKEAYQSSPSEIGTFHVERLLRDRLRETLHR